MIIAVPTVAIIVTLYSLPSTAPSKFQPDISAQERAATLAALESLRHARPIIAIVGANEGTETTDYLVPFAVLKRADVADVIALGTQPGPITMIPALSIVPDATVAEFDAQHPDGADYVVVPALLHDDDAAVIDWIKAQAGKGAIIVGICAGVRVLGNARLLDDHAGTTHWFEVAGLQKHHPTMRYVADRRYLVDRGVVTTTGVSASVPVSLALVEAIAGNARAVEVARDLGVDAWDARHDSGAFCFTRSIALVAAANLLAFWNHEQVGIRIEPGVDEIALAFISDAWSRTFKSSALTIADGEEKVMSRCGIEVVPDLMVSDAAIEFILPPVTSEYPVRALDAALTGIAERYGKQSRAFVALQLEYPLPDTK